MAEAAAAGAQFVLTPECTNLLSSNRDHQRRVLRAEADDPTLAALRDEAARAGIWLLIGSLGLTTSDADGRFANRSLLIDPSGAVPRAMTRSTCSNVNVSDTEVYRESAAYRPGERAVLDRHAPGAHRDDGLLRCAAFPISIVASREGGAQIITVPAAFNHITGAAHWEVLLRARAIETGCIHLAPAQTGFHPEAQAKGRRTHGHSLVVAPWGEVLADGGTEPGLIFAEIDLAQVDAARGRVPSLGHDRAFEGP